MKLTSSARVMASPALRPCGKWFRQWAATGLGACVMFVGACLGSAAHTNIVGMDSRNSPELLSINQGDTVWFAWSNRYSAGYSESYTGEWKSYPLYVSRIYPYTFTKPGTYVYRGRAGVSTIYYFPGLIQVQPVTGAYPAVWLTQPIRDHKVYYESTVEAATTNPPEAVVSMDFYVDGQWFGSATNPPYAVRFKTNVAGDYNLTASVVDTAGRTNTSVPVRLSVTENWYPKLSVPWRLPGGQTAMFVYGWRTHYAFLISKDVQGPVWQGSFASQGDWMIVDEETNVVRRFYRFKYF